MNATEKPGKERLIVLIDDEPSVLMALKLLLCALGFQVKDFAKSKDAVAYLSGGGAVSLIVSDLRMPELDGIGVLREVKATRPDIPFILISGHASTEDVSQAR